MSSGVQVLASPRLRLVPLSLQAASAMLEGRVLDGADHADGYPSEATLVAAAIVVMAAREGRDLGPWQLYQVVREGRVVGGMGFIEGPDEHRAVRIVFSETAEAAAEGYSSEGLATLIAHAREHGATAVHAEAGHPRLAEVFAEAGMRVAGEADGVTHFVA